MYDSTVLAVTMAWYSTILDWLSLPSAARVLATAIATAPPTTRQTQQSASTITSRMTTCLKYRL